MSIPSCIYVESILKFGQFSQSNNIYKGGVASWVPEAKFVQN